MQKRKLLKHCLLIQTIFFAVAFLAIGAAFGYYEAMREIAELGQ